MPGQLIHAHSTAQLHTHAFEFLKQHTTALILAPTRPTADDLIRDACSVPGQGFLATQRLTLTQLAAQLAASRLATLGLKPASRLAIEALTTRIIATANKAQQIPYFSPVAATPGLAPAIAATLTELRLEQVDTLPVDDLLTLLRAFEEDRAILNAVQQSFTDSPTPNIDIAIDAAPLRFRRRIAQLIAAESSGAATSAD